MARRVTATKSSHKRNHESRDRDGDEDDEESNEYETQVHKRSKRSHSTTTTTTTSKKKNDKNDSNTDDDDINSDQIQEDIKWLQETMKTKKEEWMESGHPATVFLKALAGEFGLDNHSSLFDTSTYNRLCQELIKRSQDRLTWSKEKGNLEGQQNTKKLIMDTKHRLKKLKRFLKLMMHDVSILLDIFIHHCNDTLDMIQEFDTIVSISSSSSTTSLHTPGNIDAPGPSRAKRSKVEVDNTVSGSKFRPAKHIEDSTSLSWKRRNHIKYLHIHPILFPNSPFITKSSVRDKHHYGDALDLKLYRDTQLLFKFSLGVHRPKDHHGSIYSHLIGYPLFYRSEMFFKLWINDQKLKEDYKNGPKLFETFVAKFYSNVLRDYKEHVDSFDESIQMDKGSDRYLYEVMEYLLVILDRNEISGFEKEPEWMIKICRNYLEIIKNLVSSSPMNQVNHPDGTVNTHRIVIDLDPDSPIQRYKVMREQVMGLLLSQMSPMYIQDTIERTIQSIQEGNKSIRIYLNDLDMTLNLVNVEFQGKHKLRQQNPEVEPFIVSFDQIQWIEKFSTKSEGSTPNLRNVDPDMDIAYLWKNRLLYMIQMIIPFVIIHMTKVFAIVGMIEIEKNKRFESESESDDEEKEEDEENMERESHDGDESSISEGLDNYTTRLSNMTNRTFVGNTASLGGKSKMVKRLEVIESYAESRNAIYDDVLYPVILNEFSKMFKAQGIMFLICNGIIKVTDESASAVLFTSFMGHADFVKLKEECKYIIPQWLSVFNNLYADHVNEIDHKELEKVTRLQSLYQNSKGDPKGTDVTPAFNISKTNMFDENIFGVNVLTLIEDRDNILHSMDQEEHNNSNIVNTKGSLGQRAESPFHYSDKRFFQLVNNKYGNDDTDTTTTATSTTSSSSTTSTSYKKTMPLISEDTVKIFLYTVSRLQLVSHSINSTFKSMIHDLTHMADTLDKSVEISQTKRNRLIGDGGKMKDEKLETGLANMKAFLSLPSKVYWIMCAISTRIGTDYARQLESLFPIRMNDQVLTDARAVYDNILNLYKVHPLIQRELSNDVQLALSVNMSLAEKALKASSASNTYSHAIAGIHGFLYSRDDTMTQLFANAMTLERVKKERIRPIGQPYVQKQAMVWTLTKEEDFYESFLGYVPRLQGFTSFNMRNIKDIKRRVRKNAIDITTEEAILNAFKFSK